MWYLNLWCSLILLSKLVTYIDGHRSNALDCVAEWKEMEFVFPSEEYKMAAIKEGKYVTTNSVPIDVDVFHHIQHGKIIFVTIPRFLTGVPVTLGTLTSNMGRGGPKIQPYPSYSWHSSHGKNCDGLTSVFRVAIDKCNRMWVLDSGRIGDYQHCPPQLVVFNLINNQLLHRYKFPKDQFKANVSLFITPIVDVRDPMPGKCLDTMVYIADVTGFGIIVYNFRQNKSWRIQNKLMYPTPRYATFTVSGETFDLMDGILGMSISPPISYGIPNFTDFFGGNYLHGKYPINKNERVLYFHALASTTEVSVPLRILDNYSIWEKDQNAEPRAFIEIGSRGIQGTAQAMDRNGNLFFGLISPNAISCWDSQKPYKSTNMQIVAQDETKLQFASGVKVIVNHMGKEEVWVLTSRIQKFMLGTYNWNETNFRIIRIPIEEALNGARCSGGSPEYNFPTYNLNSFSRRFF